MSVIILATQIGLLFSFFFLIYLVRGIGRGGLGKTGCDWLDNVKFPINNKHSKKKIPLSNVTLLETTEIFKNPENKCGLKTQL